MAIMEIPGYYYDEIKKKYFKITNGGVSSQYHNNIIQAKKRRIEHDIETKTINSDISRLKTQEQSKKSRNGDIMPVRIICKNLD